MNSLGASLLVLSPQLQAFTQPGAARHRLGFPILTDRGNTVGAAYGLAFRLPDDLIEVYKSFGNDLAVQNSRCELDAVDAGAHRDPPRRHRGCGGG